MPKTAKNGAFVIFFEKKCSKILPVSKMAVILQRFSREISSSGLGRRPLTAETRVRVPVSLPSKAFSIRAGGFLVCCDKASARFPMPGPPCPVPRARFPVPQLSCGLVSHPRSPCGPSVTLSCRCKPPAARRPSWSRRCTTRPRPAAAGVAAVAGLSSGSCGWRHWRG